MRSNGRRADEPRNTVITPNWIATAEGSAMIECGNTRVLCAATLEDAVPPWMRGGGRGWVTAEYSMLPRSTATRTPREVVKGKQSGRTMEIQRLIGRSLRAVVDLDALGERSIVVDCDVLQADGGTRTASITGAWVALAIALQRLNQCKPFTRQPLRDHVAAISAGIVKGEPLLDLDYEEDSGAQVDMNIVMTGSGEFIELQATGEKSTFGDDQLARLIALGRAGVAHLVTLQKEAVARA